MRWQNPNALVFLRNCGVIRSFDVLGVIVDAPLLPGHLIDRAFKA